MVENGLHVATSERLKELLNKGNVLLSAHDLPPAARRLSQIESDGRRETLHPLSVRNGLDFFYYSIELVIRGVKMRSDANSGIRPVIDQYLAADKLTHHFFSGRNIDNHHTATGLRIATGAHGKTGLVRKLDQALSLTKRLCAYGIDADLVGYLVA